MRYLFEVYFILVTFCEFNINFSVQLLVIFHFFYEFIINFPVQLLVIFHILINMTKYIYL